MKNESNYSALLHFCNIYKLFYSKNRIYWIHHYVITIESIPKYNRIWNSSLDYKILSVKTQGNFSHIFVFNFYRGNIQEKNHCSEIQKIQNHVSANE